jgi:hypothetical protein
LNHYCLLLFRAVAPWLDKNGFSDGSIMPGTSWRPPGALSRTFEGTFGIQSWYEINRRILLFAALLPTGRYRQFRAEDILNDSDRVLRGEQARDARMGGPINVWRGSLYQPRDRGRAGAESPESCAGADSLDYLRARPSLSLSQIVALQRNRFEIKGDSPAIPWHEWYRMNQIFRKNRMVENLNRKSCKSC